MGREWRSPVEVRAKRGWERKRQIVSRSVGSVSGRHGAGCMWGKNSIVGSWDGEGFMEWQLLLV